jgi:hypothetical protein
MAAIRDLAGANNVSLLVMTRNGHKNFENRLLWAWKVIPSSEVEAGEQLKDGQIGRRAKALKCPSGARLIFTLTSTT